MATLPLGTLRFQIVFWTTWCLWAILHTLALRWFGFAWEVAVWDSLVSNIVLVLMTAMVTVPLQYYLPQRNKYSYILALCVFSAILWFFVSRGILLLVAKDALDYTRFFSQSAPIRLAIAFLIIGCVALMSVVWHTMQDSQQIEMRKAEAERLSKEAELFKLRQQLQPHFLFNSLNSINALIGQQPQQARHMVQQLSDFLRGTLKREDMQWITLHDELYHLRLYLDIERVRFGHRLSTVISDDTQGECRIPALLLQPVVENAIKFGLYDTTEPITISIEATKSEGNLVVVVTNPFDPSTSTPKGTGFGLSSIHRRLYLLFADHSLLQTEARGTLFMTTLKIPQT